MTNVASIVNAASKAVLSGRVTIYGQNEYGLSSNFIYWEGYNSTIEGLAQTFGSPVRSSDSQLFFVCGDSEISAFDYGLLYSAFCALRQASIELGTSFECSTEDVGKGIHVLWVGNELIIYSFKESMIIPVSDKEVESICNNKTLDLQNYTSVNQYRLQREGKFFVLSSENGEYICKFGISHFVQRAYQQYFTTVAQVIDDDPTTPWDERSPLGSLIAESLHNDTVESALKKYDSCKNAQSIVNRQDLIVTPSRRYTAYDAFPGSICYTDKEQIVLAVNTRDNLFICRPWFDGSDNSTLRTYTNPDYSKFFDITEECRRIEAFASSILCRPLSTAEFDISVFCRIRSKFFSGELKRMPLASCLGKMVIPENVLLREVSGDTGETIYFAVPVGVVGTSVICINSEGFLEARDFEDWSAGYVFVEE